MQRCAEGIYLVGIYGSPAPCGAWILENKGHCALLEMPMVNVGMPDPVSDIKNIMKEKDWKAKYILCSHPHFDHFGGILSYRREFLKSRLVVHKSFVNWINPNFSFIFDKVFKANTYKLSLGGEPLYLIFAPKHSEADVMVIFKGAIFTGDWWIGKGDPNWSRISQKTVISSIKRLKKFAYDKNYFIHMLFSTHANDFRYDIDFHGIMNETLSYHKDKLAHIRRLKRQRKERYGIWR